jgi:hypothetical protein
LVVTDPDRYTITADTVITTSVERLREIPGVLYYSESNLLGNTSLDATVYAPTLKKGAYVVRPVPKPNALPTDTYSLDVEIAGKTIQLAQDVLVQNIPTHGYGVASTGSDITTFIPIAIDIKPGGTPNSINSGSSGIIPVAILSSRTFDSPNGIAQAYLTFGRTGDERSFEGCAKEPEDVNGDGLPDMVCRFDIQRAGFQIGDTLGTLKGQTRDGIPVMATDSVRVVR